MPLVGQGLASIAEQFDLSYMSLIYNACRCIKGEPAIEAYYDLHFEAEKHHNQIYEIVMNSSAAQEYLKPGRVVVVKSQLVSLFP